MKLYLAIAIGILIGIILSALLYLVIKHLLIIEKRYKSYIRTLESHIDFMVRNSRIYNITEVTNEEENK